MKKLLILLTAVVMIMSLTACGGITQCKDCGDDIYKDGYCQYHYTLHQAQDSVDSAAKGIFDIILGN